MTDLSAAVGLMDERSRRLSTPASGAVLARLVNVRVVYSARLGVKKEIGPVTFDIPAGQISYLEGPNGCGKSTILRCIVGLQEHSGYIERRRQNIAFLPQRNSDLLFPWLTLERHVEAFGREPVRQHLEKTRENLQRLLWPPEKTLWRTAAGTLSGGLQQLFALAFVMATPRTDLFVLDEPVSALDSGRRARALELLHATREQNPAIGVLITSQVPLTGLDTLSVEVFA